MPHAYRRETRQYDNKNNQLNSEGQKAIRREQHQAQRRNNKRYGSQDSRWERPQQRTRDSSVDVGSGWRVVEQINFPVLLKLRCTVADPETLKECGSLRPYDKQYERLTAKTCKPLDRIPQDVNYYNVTCSEDPVLQKFASEDVAQVYATDQVIAVLMASPRSVYSWDIVATKTEDGKIFLDKRPNSVVDYLTVNETANDPPSDEREGINNVSALSQEATLINLNFSQHLLQKKAPEEKFASPNPFEQPGSKSVTMAYRYRKFSMDGTEIIVRTELDTFMDVGGKRSFVKLCALNEFDPRLSGSVDWRRKLDTQNGAVLAAELKNNSNKLAMWTAKAQMAGADHMRMGFVSRVHPKDCYNHSILQVQTNTTAAFARQINLDMEQCWGIVKGFVDVLGRQEPGKYVMLKDPNKPLVRIYAVPEDAFDAVAEEAIDEEMEELDYDDDFQ
jgi:translation initiation factor 3 subunit D